MLKLAMKKHFISIILFLLCLLVSSPVEAHLTLGVVIGTDEGSSEITSDRAHSLASLLAEKLQEEVVVKELSDSATLINWLDHLAALDLALLSVEDIKANRDKFLLVGQFDEQGKLNLFARQDLDGDLLQRVARIARESGFVPWRSAEPIELVASPGVEQPEVTVVVADVAPREQAPPVFTSIKPEVALEAVVGKEPSEDEQQKIIEEVLTFVDAVPAHELAETSPTILDEETGVLSGDEIVTFLGEDTVALMVAQPDIPPELRPPGVPIIRPGRLPQRATVVEDELLVASIPEPRRNIEPSRPPKLLPEPEPEPGVIYVVPFVAIMVPDEVNARIFDQFVDLLNREGAAFGLQFVILKEGLRRVTPEWLAIRKYVTGEIYAYVEDAGSSWTELRTKARVTYRHPGQDGPAFGFEYPVKNFFDHDRSSLEVERIKMADNVAMVLAEELLKALQN